VRLLPRFLAFVRVSPRFLAAGVLAALLPGGPASAAPPSEDLAAKAQHGKEAMAAGRFEEAAALYADVVQALPNEPGMLLNLGMALCMAGRPREALPQLRAALRLNPDLLPASLFLGTAHVELGQPAQAVEPLQTFLAAQPHHLPARQMLADTLLSLERYEPAARHYRTLSEEDPQNPKAWYGLGRSYEGLAQRAFAELQRSSPKSVYVLLLVAQGLVAQERDKRAFALYREALDQNPGFAEAHEGLALIYERSGHPEWAAVERDKARSLPAPDCRSASLECDFRAGRYQAILEATRSLRTAEGRYWLSRGAGELARAALARLDALPPSPEATLVRVEILRGQRRYLQLKEELQKATSAWPEELRIRRELATLHFIAHEQAAARRLLEDLLKRDPDSAELNLMLGESWLESKEAAKAVPYLEKAALVDPKLLRTRAVLGRAYLEAGEPARAVPHLEAGLSTDEDGSVHFQLARAYRETGQPDAARRTLEVFQRIRQANEARAQSEKEEFAIKPP
jgi:tetratricopeptide (TPR) repeat protein